MLHVGVLARLRQLPGVKCFTSNRLRRKGKNHYESFLKSTSVILPDYSRFFRTEDANYSKGGIICFGSQSLA